MMLFQKIYPLVGILLLSSGIFLTVDSKKKDKVLKKNKVLKSIEKTSEKVFPPDENLLDKKNTKINKWYKMLADVRGYVNKNAGGNEDLLDAYSLCFTASRELIKVLNNTYNSIFAEGTGNMTHDSVTTAYLNIDRLATTYVPNLFRMKRKLESVSYSGGKKDVRKILMSLNMHIRKTIEKLNNEFKFRKHSQWAPFE